MILVTAGAYVGQELQSGFGRVPPCMLPVGNRPILELQIEVLRQKFPDERLVLSLPASFQCAAGQTATFARHRIETIAVKEGLTLADSVLYVINAMADDGGNLRILHGDTLIFDLPDGDNVIATGRTQTDYPWEIEGVNAREEIVWSGYFSFASARQLSRCLALSGGNFAAAVHNYDAGCKLVRAEVTRWLDVGHINTFFAAREKVTTERSFNSITIADGCVLKTGDDHRKIRGEINWLRSVPRMIKLRTPQLIEAGEDAQGRPYYITEYMHLVPLNELYVHGRQSVIFWNSIYGHCDKFLRECRGAFDALAPQVRAEAELRLQAEAQQLRVTKTGQRLQQFAQQRGFALDQPWRINGRERPSLWSLFGQVSADAAQQPCVPGVMHGDFCFSNILYDSRANAIKVIDPRGVTQDGALSIYGDLTYDIAKLSHSVLGLYDYILAGSYTLEVQEDDYSLAFELCVDPWLQPLQQAYATQTFLDGQVSLRACLPQVILLFLSMLPLHADDERRQLALMANAYRLYDSMESA